MTPARKAAMQFFHDLGEEGLVIFENPPSDAMVNRMINEGQLDGVVDSIHTLTDAGRRALNGDPDW